MSQKVVIEALQAAIASKKAEIEILEAQVREVERAMTEGTTRKVRRRRKETGLRSNGLPAVAANLLQDGPLAPAELADGISKEMGKKVETRTLAAGLKGYIDDGRFFQKTADGLYALKK